MGNDEDLLTELSALFASECPERLAEIKQAMTLGDSKSVERAAHKLKGTASSFAAQTTSSAAQRLEEMGHSGDLTDGPAAYDQLETEVLSLVSALNSVVARHGVEKTGLHGAASWRARP